jgi:protein TonB
MIARYAISIALGTAVTFALLFIMQLLIATGRAALTESSKFRIVDFVRVEEESVVETKKDKPEKPPEPEQPPPDMPQPDLDNFDTSATAIQIAAPNMSANVSVGGVGIGVSDGEYLPIVKVAPIYPRRAQSRGIEGYVIVEFTVTRTGTVKDVVVVESSNSIFERAASAAALKFKYKPRVIDGEAVEVPGVRNKITFQLED